MAWCGKSAAPGTTRPSRIFELTPEVEQLLSRAYIPLLTHLVDVFANGLPPRKLEKLLREAGRMLAADLSPSRPSGPLKTRVTAISVLLNEQLGAITHEENGGYVIRGEGCPLSALTGKHPIVCQAMESLIEDIVGGPARQCCDRADRPRCCFHIDGLDQPLTVAVSGPLLRFRNVELDCVRLRGAFPEVQQSNIAHVRGASFHSLSIESRRHPVPSTRQFHIEVHGQQCKASEVRRT